MSARCTRRGCGTPLIERHDKTIGRIAWACPRCERIKARNDVGLCADCDAARPDTHSVRCRACASARNKQRDLARQHLRLRDPDVRERKNAKRRTRYRRDRAFRQANINYTREYIRTHPRQRDAAENAYQRAWQAAHPATKAQRKRQADRRRKRYATDPVYRERIKAQQRIRDARHREKVKATMVVGSIADHRAEEARMVS